MSELNIYSELELKISKLRKRLIEIGIQKGLNHQETIKCSQRLDKLIVKQFLISNQKIKQIQHPIKSKIFVEM